MRPRFRLLPLRVGRRGKDRRAGLTDVGEAGVDGGWCAYSTQSPHKEPRW